ncbi:peptidoglycan D,D-transpeptidase FtsI family protein [Gorillibacterium sp. sgz5001074]|uniref:peptidoglycan D,D-transpeptidase FtsI family protein n=1 Tax=Gorillibacterium sp. sgz5001074 TaxID=3446695 RepID=UPI003F665C3C
MEKRRIFGMLLVMMAGLGIVSARLFWLQTRASVADVDLTRQSVLQREQRLLLDSGRGDFLDRLGRPLTGESYRALLVFPAPKGEEGSAREIERLCALLGTRPEEWRRFRAELQTPRFWPGVSGQLPARLSEEAIRAIEGIQLDGLAVVPFERRYTPPYPASQLIGFIGQDPGRVRTEFAPMLQEGRLTPDSRIGASGLEKTFEPLIAGLGGVSISLYTDPFHRPIAGIGYRLHAPNNPYYPLQTVTTLDLELQKQLEQEADQAGLKEGAIVLLDARNADLLGMVSRPTFDPDHVDLSTAGWSNRALKEAVPGSVFKMVVAAAALESGAVRPEDTFECHGALGKYHFTCWKKEGHGKLTFREGFAQSCNIVFGEVMKRLKPGQLEETARRMGLGLPAGWEGKVLRFPSFRQLDGEETGRIWAGGIPQEDEGVKLQTSIGQRDVRLTPLQAANMVVTILNGGQAREVRAVKELRYGTGQLLARFPEKKLPAEGKLSKRTTEILRGWMTDVVEEGTGSALQSARWKLAGKSGTAQAPEGAKEWFNQWFVGYGPAEAPRYAVAVVSLRQERSGPEAVRLFGRVMDLLAAWESRNTKEG